MKKKYISPELLEDLIDMRISLQWDSEPTGDPDWPPKQEPSGVRRHR